MGSLPTDMSNHSRYRRRGRSTHSLMKQSWILTSASCNTAKVQIWVHRSENTLTQTQAHTHTAEGKPLQLPPHYCETQIASLTPLPPSSLLLPPLCLPSYCITDTLLCCSSKRTERKGFKWFFSRFPGDVGSYSMLGKGKGCGRRKRVWGGFRKLGEEGGGQGRWDPHSSRGYKEDLSAGFHAACCR